MADNPDTGIDSEQAKPTPEPAAITDEDRAADLRAITPPEERDDYPSTPAGALTQQRDIALAQAASSRQMEAFHHDRADALDAQVTQLNAAIAALAT